MLTDWLFYGLNFTNKNVYALQLNDIRHEKASFRITSIYIFSIQYFVEDKISKLRFLYSININLHSIYTV